MKRRAFPPGPKVLLRLGAKGRHVVWLQEQLQALGHDIGVVDGFYGYLTEDCVCSLQSQYGLVVDGMAGPKVFELLKDKDVMNFKGVISANHQHPFLLWGGLQQGPNGADLQASGIYNKLDGVLLYNYTLGDAGDLVPGPSPPELGVAKGNFNLLPVITNLWEENYNRLGLEQLLRAKRRRHHLMDTVAGLAGERKYAGITLDFHEIGFGYGRPFSNLVKKISRRLRQHNKGLFMTLVPTPMENPFPKYIDNRIWLNLAQRVVLRGFKEYVIPEPGPRLGLKWLQVILSRVLSYISPWKLIVSIPLGGIAWTMSEQGKHYEYITYNDAQTLAYTKRAKPQWDVEEKTPYYHYHEGKEQVRVWYEDRTSLAAKLTWLESQRIGGVLLHPLGWEDTRIW